MRSASERPERPKEGDFRASSLLAPASNDSPERACIEPNAIDPDSDLTAMVRAELPFVWRLLRRTGLSPADADDAAQQVFLVAARRAEDIEPGKLRKFLYGTALRVASNARRALRRQRESPNDAVGNAISPEPLPDELVAQRRARGVLDEILGELTPMLGRVLVLADIENLTLAEIAELEDIPAGTAASRLRRARDAFTEQLAKRRAPHRRSR